MATHFMFVSAQKLNEKGSQKCDFKSSFERSTFESFDRLSCGRQHLHYCEVKERRNRPARPNFSQSRERERERERERDRDRERERDRQREREREHDRVVVGNFSYFVRNCKYDLGTKLVK
jgi:hypothetical protein